MRTTSLLGASVLLVGMTLAPVGAFAASADAGMVKTVKGQVDIVRDGQTLPVRIGDLVMQGDQVNTGSDSSVGITLRDDTLLSAGARSTLVINRFDFNPTTHAGHLHSSIKRGTLAVIDGKIAKAHPEDVQFSTDTITLGVRGTEFIIDTGK